MNDDIVACALQLIQRLDAAQSGHGIQVELVPVLIHDILPQTENPKLPKAATKAVSKVGNFSSISNNFTDVSQLHVLNLPAGQKPKQLRLPNGIIKPISIWKDILLEVCYLVLETNSQLPLPLPDRAGKKRFLLSKLKPATGSSTQSDYQGLPVFIGTHYSAADCISNALYALHQLPSSQKSTTLAVSF